jgi:tRNA pseudouridine55 synthase
MQYVKIVDMDSDFNRMILIDKPSGISSFGVVARVRRRLRDEAGRKIKVGHTGTLDPFATGLLILLSGKMTKKSGEFLKLDKEYEAVLKLGEVSSTGDPEGGLSKVSDTRPSREQVIEVLQSLVGELKQKPSIYSAIKINGQRAYKLARKGQTPDMPERKVQIYEIELLDYQYPQLKIRTKVSSGTYIRTLAEQIGERLGTGAYCLELRRTKVGDYEIGNAEELMLEW